MFLIFTKTVFAQQIPLFSLYQFNRYVYNPAYAGNSDNNLELVFEGRRQYTGFSQGPFTNNLSFHLPLRSMNIVAGAKVLNDFLAPANYTSAMVTGGYQFQFPESQLTVAVDAGVIIRVLDYSNLIKNDQDDALLDNKGYQYVMRATPDLGVGMYYKHNNGFWGGLSVSHLAPFKYDGLSSTGLSRHYFLMGGYTYQLNENVKLDPSFLVKFTEQLTYQYDISMLCTLYQTVGFGLIYRKGNTIVPLVSAHIFKNIFLAYSYDQITNNFGRYAGASHEILLRYQLSLGAAPKKIEVDPRYY